MRGENDISLIFSNLVRTKLLLPSAWHVGERPTVSQSISQAGTLGARLKIKVVPVRTLQRGTVLVRKNSYRNTTRTRCTDQITRFVTMSSEVCK